MADNDDLAISIQKIVQEILNSPEKRRQFMEELKKAVEQPHQPPKKYATGECLVCGGEVIVRIMTEAIGPQVYGPGSSGRLNTAPEEFYCKKCGVKYAFLPKKYEGPQY